MGGALMGFSMSEETPDQIEKSILIHAPVSRVWRALTDHQEFGEWFRVKLDQPFVAGGISTGHMTYPGFEGMKWEAVIERIEPETLFSFRWQPDSHRELEEGAEEIYTHITFRLEPAPEGCLLTATESGFSKLPPHRRFDAFRDNEEGWEIQTGNIARYASENP